MAHRGTPIEGSHATWADANAMGLTHGAAGDWPSAYAAFADAAGALILENDTLAREALAVVHNNLAHASYRLGRGDEALRHAQSVHDLRVALAGDDSIAVARVRSDLAVMLSRTGRFAEAQTVIGAAIQGIERAAGDEDSRLIPLLETAARIAMAAGQPASAEPLLLRLHALLSEHQQSTATAEDLLARVARARARQTPNATPVFITPLPFTPVSTSPIASTPTVATSNTAPPTIPRPTQVVSLRPTPVTPLRPTPVTPLRTPPTTPLRLTPATPLRGVQDPAPSARTTPVIPLRPASRGSAHHETVKADPGTTPTVPHVIPVSIADVGAKDTSPLAMIGFDFELADDPRKVPPPPAPPAPISPLGFEVEYGTPQEPIIPDFERMEAGPLLAPSTITPLLGQSRGRRTPLVLPTPTKGNQAVFSPAGSRKAHVTPRSVDLRAKAPVVEAVVADSRAKARTGRAIAPRSPRGFLIAAAIAAAATAAGYAWLVVLPRG